MPSGNLACIRPPPRCSCAPTIPTNALGQATKLEQNRLSTPIGTCELRLTLRGDPTFVRPPPRSSGTVSAEDIRASVTVIPATDSNILRIRATSTSPEQAQAIANAVADAFIENRRRSAVKGLERAINDIAERGEELAAEVRRLEAADPGSDELATVQQQYRSLSDRQLDLRIDLNLKKGEAEVIAAAEIAKHPISPKPLRSGVLGLLTGLALAAVGVVVWDRLDVRLRSRQEAENLTHLPTLAEIPTDRRLARSVTQAAFASDSTSPAAEAIRSLRVSLQFLAAEAPLQVILVTSATPGDGKSTISSSLAALYAQAGERTLLVSADLRRPTVERLTGVEAHELGFIDLLTKLAVERDLRTKRVPRTGNGPRAEGSRARASTGTGTARAPLLSTLLRCAMRQTTGCGCCPPVGLLPTRLRCFRRRSPKTSSLSPGNSSMSSSSIHLRYCRSQMPWSCRRTQTAFSSLRRFERRHGYTSLGRWKSCGTVKLASLDSR